jgi:HPt (histidine-containing phosphotransfer) domain-containing protein
MSEPVNLPKLREITGGDTKMEMRLFKAFFVSADECLTLLAASCVDGESELWQESAHALRGTSVNLRAEYLGELCRQAQENQGTTAKEKQEMLKNIKSEYQRVEQFLKAQIS